MTALLVAFPDAWGVLVRGEGGGRDDGLHDVGAYDGGEGRGAGGPRGTGTGGESTNWYAEERFSGRSRLQCVTADPNQPGRIYCGTADEGLWRSDDLGRSWVRVGEGVLHPRVTAVAVSPVTEASVTEGSVTEGSVTEGSVERGASPADAGTGGGEGVVYAGTEPSALYRSRDGGESWEDCPSLLAVRSASTWSFPPRPETHHVRWIAPDPLVPGRLFVAIEAGALVTSADAGMSWTDRRPGGPYDTHTLFIHPRATERIYSAAGDGYFESRDGGWSWEQREAGLRHRYVWGLAVDPYDTETVVISTARSARSAHSAEYAESFIYRSTGGESWQMVAQGLPEPAGTTISALVADPAERGVVYAANNRGVYRSADMGVSWTRLDIRWPARDQAQRVAGMAVSGRLRKPAP